MGHSGYRSAYVAVLAAALGVFISIASAQEASSPDAAEQSGGNVPPKPEPYPETVPVKTAEKEPPLPKDQRGVARLEEVTVTAQKIKQSARDVPISMSVMTDKFVAEKGIVDIVQAMQYVPNVKIASGGFFAAPQARGFSFNNNNKAFESPLGIAFDGIPYTNTTYFNSGLFDIQRIEVLRGPQGTTFGKNTTAGLVSIITADPTPNFSSVIAVQAGQIGRRHYEAALAGPIVRDFLEFRIAGIYDKRDGFVRNTTAEIVTGVPKRLAGYKHQGWRGKLKFPDLFGTTLKLSYESVDLNNYGSGIELWHATEAVQADIRKYDPKADFVRGNDVNSEDGPDYRLAHTKTFVGEWSVPVGPWEITALGGWSQLTENMGVDVDFSPVPGLNGYAPGRYPTTSFELRAKSPSLEGLFGIGGDRLGRTDFLAGFFYQRRSIRDSYWRFVLNDVPFLELTMVAFAPGTGTGFDPTQPLNLAGTVLNPAELAGKQEIFTQHYDQTGNVLALFQQTEWKFLPHWTLQLGLRASRERKNGYWNEVEESPQPNPVSTAIGIQPFTDTRSLSETQYQPKVSLNWQPNRELSLFVHWTRGFKGGGFNAFAYRDIDQELKYKPETTTEWGFDFKGSFFGGRLRPNLSLYRMDAKEFQVLGREKPPIFELPVAGHICGSNVAPGQGADGTCIPPAVIGLGTTRVFNAEKAYAQGVEGDLNWIVFGGLSIFATLGYNDTKYVKFTQNECPADVQSTYCNASGRPFAFAPRWDATLTPSWIISLPWGLTFTPSFTAQYLSSQLLDTDLTEPKRQGGFMRYNASLALASLGQGWTLQIIGRNLGNKATAVRYGDVFANLFVSVPESPREVFAQIRYTFQ